MLRGGRTNQKLVPYSCSPSNGGTGALCSLNHIVPRSVYGYISFPAFVGRKRPYVQQAGVLLHLPDAPVEFLTCRDWELISDGPAWGLWTRGLHRLLCIRLFPHTPHQNSHSFRMSSSSSFRHRGCLGWVWGDSPVYSHGGAAWASQSRECGGSSGRFLAIISLPVGDILSLERPRLPLVCISLAVWGVHAQELATGCRGLCEGLPWAGAPAAPQLSLGHPCENRCKEGQNAAWR